MRFVFFLLFFFPLPLLAQIADSSLKVPILDTVLHENSPQKKFVVVNSISVEGNKVTKKFIILREVPFSPGDSLELNKLPKILSSAKENLLNTSLFNFVTIDTTLTLDGRMNFKITVAERWYTWPVPVFEIQERNFNVWWETKNFKRVNYGFFLNRENCRGRKEELSFLIRLGYTEKYGIAYNIPYLNKKQTLGAGAAFSYSRNKEIAYTTIDNKLIYFKDPDNYVRDELTSRITFNYREGIYNTQTFEAKFFSVHIADTVLKLTSDYFLPGEERMEYFSLYYAFVHDHRDSKAYPLQGYYYDFELTKLGLGILKAENLDVFYVNSSVRKYWKVSDRTYFSTYVKAKVSSSSTQPYYVQRGLGYKDYVRAYEYYVIDGQNYALLKGGLKYEIIKPRVKEMPLVPFPKFNKFHYALYFGFFGDAGYVDDMQYYKLNPLANKMLFGGGIGLDYVTYYDTVLRLEYAINHLQEHGLFVHFSKAF